jgi:hypothetical protein
MIRIGPLIAVSIVASIGALSARDIPAPASPVSIIVTASGQKGASAPQLTVDDVLVSENKQHMPVTGLEPLRGQSGLQLWLLIDDGSSTNLGSQLADLKRFVLAQPATTQIGIGYMRNGGVQTVQPLTSDHELAASAMRLPIGMPGISASPYQALGELIHKWPAGSAAREVLMVSSGIDPDYGSGPNNPYLDTAITRRNALELSCIRSITQVRVSRRTPIGSSSGARTISGSSALKLAASYIIWAPRIQCPWLPIWMILPAA